MKEGRNADAPEEAPSLAYWLTVNAIALAWVGGGAFAGSWLHAHSFLGALVSFLLGMCAVTGAGFFMGLTGLILWAVVGIGRKKEC